MAGIAAAGIATGLVACGGDLGISLGEIRFHKRARAATTFAVTNLVSDAVVPAAHSDPNLVNGWGIAFNPQGFAWVVANGTSRATVYDGNGVPQSPVVAIPAGAASSAGPTGIVYNGTQDFRVRQNGTSGIAPFLFASEAGTVSGWSPPVDATIAVTMVDNGNAGKVYTGLALANYAGANYLYAADFRNNSIDVFDRNFAQVALPGSFKDPSLPAGYAPYGIQAIGGRIYVAYAKQAAVGTDAVAGAGLGVIDVFDTGGNFIRQLALGGALNAPWGITMAPPDFGSFGNTLLVANFGDGRINSFDPNTGGLVGSLGRADGASIVIDGLWGIAFGNGINSQPSNTLFFAAGPQGETQGLYGRIDMR
jgi:uncharacterized protein (TIGR03118 family)